jgi:predicted transcriptional regulator
MEFKKYKEALAIATKAVEDIELRREILTRYEKHIRDNNLTVVEAADHFGIAYGTYYKLVKGKPLQIEILCKLTAQL